MEKLLICQLSVSLIYFIFKYLCWWMWYILLAIWNVSFPANLQNRHKTVIHRKILIKQRVYLILITTIIRKPGLCGNRDCRIPLRSRLFHMWLTQYRNWPSREFRIVFQTDDDSFPTCDVNIHPLESAFVFQMHSHALIVFPDTTQEWAWANDTFSAIYNIFVMKNISSTSGPVFLLIRHCLRDIVQLLT